MPRIPRTYLKTNFFHVMTQGINKSFIFDNPIDIKYYIGIMYKLKKEHDIKIIAYCVMNNHVHILIETKDLKELSKYMQRLNMQYGRYYNKKYDKVGYVFRDRFKAEGIYSEQHLQSCIRYIYNNPVKAGICNYPKEYPYSNYKEIKGNVEEGYTFIDIENDLDNDCRKVIEEYLTNNNIGINDLKKDTEKLRKLILLLRNQYSISLRRIAEEIKINREKVRNLYKS